LDKRAVKVFDPGTRGGACAAGGETSAAGEDQKYADKLAIH
jgi:hypothetical protein